MLKTQQKMSNRVNKKISFVFALFLAIVIMLPIFSLADYSSRKIIVFKTDLSDEAKDEILEKSEISKIKHLKSSKGSAVLISKFKEKELLNNPDVLRIDEDVIVSILDNNESSANGKNNFQKNASSPSQILTWNINKIDAELVWPSGNNADPIKIGVIDTGIDLTHQDLAANIKGGINTIWPAYNTSSPKDDNGHGTHVTGIIAALNNSIGVIGAAPLTDLFSIKTLDRRGSGFLSDIIEGIDWAIANGMQITNMSLGTSSDIQSFHDAVIKAKSAGIIQVAAAGNSGGAVNFPAAYPEVIAVSATDSNNLIPSWSSRGPEVDLSAPGVSIFSTYKGNKYATLSGTSMASPHVAGVTALVLNTLITPAYDINGNLKWDPEEVQNKLQNTATDLGTAGFDNLYGYGLVNAFLATQ